MGGGLCEHGERVDTGTEESLCIGNFGTHSFAFNGSSFGIWKLNRRSRGRW